MKILAIITARGGSKRIPQKNIKEFCGKPIIAYSIEAALQSLIFNEVMVTTDDNEIAQISLNLGAKVPFLRSSKASDDYATTTDVLIEVIEKYKELGKNFDYICCIYPTAPFINSDKLKNSFEILIKNGADSLIPVVKYEYPIQRALKITNNKLNFLHPENKNKRSQDLEIMYHDCGQFYWFKTTQFLEQKTLLTDNTIAYIIPDNEVRDIDSQEDWKIAEVLYQCLNSD